MACRPDAAEKGGGESTPPTPPDTASMNLASDSLGLDLVLPPRVRVGEPVPIILHVQNRTQRALDLYLRGRTITFDVVIDRPGGEVAWQRLEDEIIPAIVHVRVLPPNERLEIETVWDQRTNQGKPVEPGEYTARGFLLVEGYPLETSPVLLRILQS
jgi:hypothetical protein